MKAYEAWQERRVLKHVMPDGRVLEPLPQSNFERNVDWPAVMHAMREDGLLTVTPDAHFYLTDAGREQRRKWFGED